MLKNEIILSIENIAPAARTGVNLFKKGENGLPTADTYVATPEATDLTLGLVWELIYSEGTLTIPAGLVYNITDLVTQLNKYIFENGYPIFFIQGSKIYATSAEYTFTSIEGLAGKGAAAFGIFALGGSIGSSCIVTMETGDLSYQEVTEEINNGNYILDKVDVYARSLGQANETFILNNRNGSGILDTDLKLPKLDPYKNQYVNLGVKIGLIPDFYSFLRYYVQGGETVTLVITYRDSSLFSDKTQKILDRELIKQIPMKKKSIKSTNPMIDLATKPIKSKIVEEIKPLKTNKKFTDQEIMKGFEGSDVRLY